MTAEFSGAQVRHMFFEREQQSCFNCRRALSFSLRGSFLDGGWSLHHLMGRGAGGTSRVMEFDDGIVLCGTGVGGCHGWVESHRDISLERGLLIRRNSIRPAETRVQNRFGQWWQLTKGGRAVEVTEGITQ